MIQRTIKNILQDNIPDLEWTVDYRTSPTEFGVVYYDGGYPPKRNDLKAQRMNYQVEIRSKDFDKAFNRAFQCYNLLDDIVDLLAEIPVYEDGELLHTERHYVLYIQAEVPPIRVGVVEDSMVYTINFVALIFPYCD